MKELSPSKLSEKIGKLLDKDKPVESFIFSSTPRGPSMIDIYNAWRALNNTPMYQASIGTVEEIKEQKKLKKEQLNKLAKIKTWN